MQQVEARVVENTPVMGRSRLLRLEAPTIAARAKPGQFVMVRCGEGIDPLLPRAISLSGAGGRRGGAFNTAKGEIALLFRPGGHGTTWLGQRRPGESVPVLGPLGRGFSIASGRRHLLLIGSGWGVASLIGLAHEAIVRGTEVTIVGEFRTAAEALPAWLVPAEAEYLLAIRDGAEGGEQSVVELAEQAWRWADQVFVAGSMELLAKVAQMRRAAAVRIPVQGLFEAQMGCGVGICLSCVVETRRGYKLACADGPVFRLEEVFGP